MAYNADMLGNVQLFVWNDVRTWNIIFLFITHKRRPALPALSQTVVVFHFDGANILIRSSQFVTIKTFDIVYARVHSGCTDPFNYAGYILSQLCFDSDVLAPKVPSTYWQLLMSKNKEQGRIKLHRWNYLSVHLHTCATSTHILVRRKTHAAPLTTLSLLPIISKCKVSVDDAFHLSYYNLWSPRRDAILYSTNWSMLHEELNYRDIQLTCSLWHICQYPYLVHMCYR